MSERTAQEVLIETFVTTATGLGIMPHPELRSALAGALCSAYSGQLESFELRWHGEAFAGTCAVLNEASARLRAAEYQQKKWQRGAFRGLKQEYASGGSRITNDEVHALVAAREEADRWEAWIAGLEQLKNLAWTVRNLLTDRKEFLLEISRNRRVEARA